MKKEMVDFLSELYADFGGPGYGALPEFKGDKFKPRKGGSNHDARDIERERQQRAQAAIAAINSVFDGANRQKLYQGHRNAVYDLNTKDVERQAKDMERTNRFAMARNSLLGGSVDIDSNAEINRMTNEGLAKAGGIADAAMADLQNSDENARNNLVSMANAGTDATTASQLAINNLRQNADAAASDRAIASVGNLFSGLQNAYLNYDRSKYMTLLNQQNPYVSRGGTSNNLDPHSTYGGS